MILKRLKVERGRERKRMYAHWCSASARASLPSDSKVEWPREFGPGLPDGVFGSRSEEIVFLLQSLRVDLSYLGARGRGAQYRSEIRLVVAMALTGTVTRASPGMHGFDTSTSISAGKAAALRTAGFTFAIRYLSRSHGQHAGG